MKVRILKRTSITRNAMLFLVFSIFYLQIIKSLLSGNSALDINSYIEIFNLKPWLIALFFLTSISLFFSAKLSNFLFAFFNIIILGQSLSLFSTSFDKLVLILIFFYCISAVYFYLFLKLEKREAIYRPCFEENYLGKFSEYDFEVIIDVGVEKLKAVLTNWDEEGCFLALIEKRKTPRGKIELELSFEGLNFHIFGEIITSYGRGVGVRIEHSAGPLNWNAFYSIINDRGFKPRL